jgi:hypothetical protein
VAEAQLLVEVGAVRGEAAVDGDENCQGRTPFRACMASPVRRPAGRRRRGKFVHEEAYMLIITRRIGLPMDGSDKL